MGACNPTKDKWLNRNYHTITGRFNVYFNGQIKYNEAIEGLEKGHQDDFTKILEVFPYGDEGASKAIGGQMDEVLKKVSLSIQNHTIGRYTDDSYLLMGKAHFFKRDYYASMEAFQYINSRYKDKGLRPIATCWIAKCYTGLKKVEEAEAVIGLVLSEEVTKRKKATLKDKVFSKTSKDDTREIYATAADIAIKQGKYSTAIEKLTIALQNTSRKQDRIRYTYILGQLYLQADSVKLATKHFTKILNMLAPYDFEFNANLNLAKSYKDGDKKAARNIRRSLKRMLKDEKNEGTYDQIWYELGNLETREKNIPAAVTDYKMSANTQGKNPNQKALAHLALANIYFAIPDYRLAQAYFDSATTTLAPTYKDYQRIMDKKNVLTDLISNLVVIETEDSLQAIAKLSKAEVEKKIDQWIAAAKVDSANNARRAKERKEQQKKESLNQQNAIAGAGTPGFGEQGQWYFYNPTIMAAGSNDFFSIKKWGTRPNEDYWRIAAIEKVKQEEQSEEESKPKERTGEVIIGKLKVADSTDTPEDPSAGINNSRKAWIKDVPYTKEALDKSNDLMEEAYYNIGVIYDEKLNDFKEASANYNTLILKFPKSSYEPEVLYRLYKLYNGKKEQDKANTAKSKLINEYPESPYALLVQNKTVTSAETDANKEVVVFYEHLLQLYNEGNYAEVKAGKKEAERKYSGNNLQPKFDLLYAFAVGKTESEENFKAELTAVSAAYAKTDVAERADEILKYLKRKSQASLPDSLKVAEPDFVIESGGPYYVIIAIQNDKLDLNDILANMSNYNDEYNQFDNLKVNPMQSNDGYSLIMVREFVEYKKAFEYYNNIQILDAVKKRFKYNDAYLSFAISQANFKKMLKEKKVEAYAKFYADQQKKNQPK